MTNWQEKLHEAISFPLHLSGDRVAGSDFDDLDTEGAYTMIHDFTLVYELGHGMDCRMLFCADWQTASALMLRLAGGRSRS